MDDQIQAIAQALNQAKRLTIFTGAGVSKESGIPTFRDKDGIWSKYSPETLGTPQGFRDNPKLVWDWFEYRRNLVLSCKPNSGHFALAELDNLIEDVVVITQNVDNYHEQAGSKEVWHLHGLLNQHRCSENCQGKPTLLELNKLDRTQTPPHCPHCDAYVRPNVVWFRELLPEDILANAKQRSAENDVMLVIGTTGLVDPAGKLPRIAKRNDSTVIEVNPSYSMITRFADYKLEAPSGEALPQVISAMKALS